ncbi:serine/arginine repetitive matrix protein 1 [Aedes aegypti]|uniref:Uncharacterized protein n=1 Tax=Aedes aegypti TaxID=7159 RepID=A0A1S4FI11_AEDAE|nr:serine/arginine repetitive matrix protein 1 [Aedes aegypti]
MESCCRACSRSDDFRRFSLYAVAEVSQEVIANMIRDTSDTQVSTEDGLPQQICPDCLMTLSLAYSFRKQCRRSDAKFREYWGGRTPSQSVDQQQHQQQQQQQSQQHQLPRRSQSQIPEESSFEAVATTIKEEVDIYDYEYSVPAGHDNQWVIQNPRTIGEGAMTVVHNTGGHYYDEGAASETGAAPDRDGHGMLHPMDDAAEMGESSGLGQKDDKLKKNVPNPERYSQRIRRQEISASMIEPSPRNTESDWGRFSVSVIPEASLMATTSTPTASTTGQQQRCQHCMKKMKKPYKHRNGKCLEPKYKASSRPKCAYCHQTFSSSKGIPSHLRNSCRVYRQVCEAKGISLPPAEHSSSPYDTSSVPSETPEPPSRKGPAPSQLNAKPTNTIEQKPKLRRTKTTASTTNWSHSIECQYCSKKFLKKAALNRHMQKQCLVWVRKQTANLAKLKSIKEVTTGVPLPLPPPPASSSLDDKSAIVREQQQPAPEQRAAPPQPAVAVAEELTKCVYCQQSVGKKTRFLHHNGRCVLGRVNAEHPCPHCPEAFMTRSLLLKHRCDPAQKFENPQKKAETVEQTPKTNALPPERKQRRIAKLTPKKLALVKAKTPAKQQITPRKQQEIPQETPTSIVKREFCSHCRQRIKESDRQKHEEKRCSNNNQVSYNCGYCRKGFAARDTMIEHQRVCTVRKQHKQVKCQFCGSMISNRGNLKKHQKVYCKAINRPDDVKSEKSEPQKQEKSQKSEKPEPQKSEKSPKPNKPKTVKSEKPLKLKKVKDEEPVKKKPKIKKEKPKQNSKTQDEDMENIPLKQRKLQKPKSAPVSKAVAVATKKLNKKPLGAKKLRCFPCQYCKVKFEKESLARKHSQKCTVKRPALKITCEHCKQRFSKKGNLERHLRLKCKKINRDRSILNHTINELIKPKITDTANPTPQKDIDENEKEEPVADRTETDPLEHPSEPQPAEPSEPELERSSPETERSSPEPTEASPSIAEQPVEPPEISVEPPEIPAEPSPTSSVHEDDHETDIEDDQQEDIEDDHQVDDHDVDHEMSHEIDHEVPEPIDEEIILQEAELLPTTEDEEMDDLEEAEMAVAEPEDPLEEQDPVPEESLTPDDHQESDNNNAEPEKDSSPDVRQPPSTESDSPMSIERHDQSHQSAEELPECEAESTPADPMPEN